MAQTFDSKNLKRFRCYTKLGFLGSVWANSCITVDFQTVFMIDNCAIGSLWDLTKICIVNTETGKEIENILFQMEPKVTV